MRKAILTLLTSSRWDNIKIPCVTGNTGSKYPLPYWSKDRPLDPINRQIRFSIFHSNRCWCNYLELNFYWHVNRLTLRGWVVMSASARMDLEAECHWCQCTGVLLRCIDIIQIWAFYNHVTFYVRPLENIGISLQKWLVLFQSKPQDQYH